MGNLSLALLIVAFILFLIEGIRSKSLVAIGLASWVLALLLTRGILNG